MATLVRRLKTVDAATTYLEEDARSSFRDDLRRALRDCQITSLLYDHMVIAVAGDQGAGKTRLMRLLYDLDTTWLGDNAGRGEYLPVLVLEDPSKGEVHGCIYRWNDETDPGEPRGEPVCAERFQQAVRSWTGDVLELPVLRVPTRYFGGQKNHGFLLLPGYEKITASNRPWQEFMRLALVASSACILVTNGGLLAQEQDAIRTDLQKNQLSGVQPVIAITGTETLPVDRQEQLRATAAERFQVPLSGVICTGIGDQDYQESIRTSILDALNRQGGAGLGARQRQLEDLEELSLQIGTVVSEARQAVRSSRDAQPENEEMRLEIMEALENSIEITRGDYKRNLEQKLNSVERQALAIARRDFDETESGWDARLRDARDFVALKFGGAEDRMYARLQSAVDQSGGGAAFAATHATVLADLSRQQLDLPEPSESLSATTAEDKGTAGEPTVVRQQAAPTGPQRSLKALQRILSHRRDHESPPLCGQDAKELKQAVRLLPAIATSYMSLMQSAVAASTAPGEVPTTDLRQILQDITDTTVEMHGLTKPLLKAAAGVLAIDVAVDGEIDTIPAFVNAILTVLQGSSSAAGSSATVAAGSVSMALGAAVLTYGVISALEKQQTKGRAHVSEAIRSAFREQRTQHLAYFDEVMCWIKRRVSDQMEVVLRLDESLGHRFRATLAIDDLRNAQTSFLDEMRGRPA
ncbi:hypothetical protein [Novosphingobium taihuense]|uniref:Uncharacterized protein n=1 Tax=Novosphingobium taihuense TaxID=260085 RepID=A0A7W7AEV3_9SPHN|nr:hypothetical protein [Novosphingobium taihuense]MBB4615760.1 hypothetical protein [Novosphingobium taihuense]